jgi:hypothetical protein
LYGEGTKHLSGRKKKPKAVDDLYLFPWQDQDDSEFVHHGLAQSPAEFSNFSLSWALVDIKMAWTLPGHFDQKTWITLEHACVVTNLSIQLSVMLLKVHGFYESALRN